MEKYNPEKIGAHQALWNLVSQGIRFVDQIEKNTQTSSKIL